MACSDNTVRAGLTSKFKDVDTLCSDLTFEMIESPYFCPKIIGPGIREYAPPVQEFAVHELRVISILWINSLKGFLNTVKLCH